MRLGYYRHFKGTVYELLGIAKHSETQEPLVVYRSTKTDELWVRPEAMFLDHIDRDGYEGPRFIFIQDKLAGYPVPT